MEEDKISVGPGPDERVPLVRLREYKVDPQLREILELCLAKEQEHYLSAMGANLQNPGILQAMTAAFDATRKFITTLLA